MLFLALNSAQAARAEHLEISEPQLWQMLYAGEFTLPWKMVLCRDNKSTNDELLGQFMMAYLYYRQGGPDKMHKVENIFKGVDSYVRHFYFPVKESDE